MGFDLRKFENSQFTHKTRDVPVPALAHFFEEGEDAIWIVRGMSHAELSKMRDVPQNEKVVSAAISAIAGDDKSKVDIIKELIGDTDSIPERTRSRIELIVMCSVTPKINKQVAVKLAEFFPAEFEGLTNIIFELSDEGPLIAKKKPLRATTQ